MVFLQFRSKLSELITGLDCYNDFLGNLPVFGDSQFDDLFTFFFTQYGDFWGDLPELVIIKVMV